MPMILRPSGADQYRVIGEAYVHGRCDGEALVGQMKDPWKIRITSNDSKYVPAYDNPDADISTFEDPRLGPLPSNWVAVQDESGEASGEASSDPKRRYKNTSNDEEMTSDPRLLPETLKANGVKLRTFKLA